MQVIENESTDLRAAARSSVHVVGSDSGSARREPAGAVERAFTSVRIVEANVCAGGDWLMPPKDDVEECNCALNDESECGCGDGCINRASRYECAVESCPCGERCSNRQLQVGSTITTAVVDCGRRGVGVILLEPVDAGRYIGEYVGEVITCREAHERALIYQHEKHSYMLQVRASEVIDATRIGSRMRFVNHSCNPNCRVEKWCVRGRERGGLFAARRIGAGDELTFDYQFHCFSATRTIECLCGSRNCRGLIGAPKRQRADESMAKHSDLPTPASRPVTLALPPYKRRMRQLTMDSFICQWAAS